jgi:hypothetical protein
MTFEWDEDNPTLRAITTAAVRAVPRQAELRLSCADWAHEKGPTWGLFSYLNKSGAASPGHRFRRSVGNRRRRATPVITSTFENVSDIGVCLGLSLGPPAKPVSGQNREQFRIEGSALLQHALHWHVRASKLREGHFCSDAFVPPRSHSRYLILAASAPTVPSSRPIAAADRRRRWRGV